MYLQESFLYSKLLRLVFFGYSEVQKYSTTVQKIIICKILYFGKAPTNIIIYQDKTNPEDN